ncbi:MAG: acetate--CoA ligase [Chitinophagales bacterium]|nr:acetate--CoA ligase [Chitinophagales bacterium]
MTLQIKSLDEYKQAYKKSIEDPETFWADQAKTFEWFEPWSSVLNFKMENSSFKWFEGGKLNITVNCLDRHLSTRGDKTALIWEANDESRESVKLTYKELLAKVCQCSNALKELGIKKGDRVVFYMPMVVELAIGVLACARIGAIHSVVFAGFSANALADRVKDAGAELIICSDFNFRGNKCIEVKSVVDQAISQGCDSVRNVLMYKNSNKDVDFENGRDVWWHDIVDKQLPSCDPEIMDAEDPLFILYTSGSTGKPKGVVHSCAGYMVYTCYSFKNVFQYKENDIYWCTADIGWITGHSYIIYGPLLAGATTMMFEGVPTYPEPDRFWKICKKHSVTQFYTAPTAIRALMAQGDKWVDSIDMPSLQVLGSVGEPINEEAWHWYNDKVGKKRAQVVDTWWQTETGGIMITSIPGVTDSKPTYASYPLPGVQPVLVDPKGNTIEGNNVEGLLCIEYPWPSILRTTYGDHDRCIKTYFSPFPGKYFTGDGARRDEDGRIRVIGRVDDVINVSGHRIGTAEVENAIDEHENVVESAVVGFPHEIKGQGIYAFVISDGNIADKNQFIAEINGIVKEKIGAIARPDKIKLVEGLPKTRSGKIMRRILRLIAADRISDLGDTSTLLNPEVVEKIISEKTEV